jgi:hypothetical protein
MTDFLSVLDGLCVCTRRILYVLDDLLCLYQRIYSVCLQNGISCLEKTDNSCKATAFAVHIVTLYVCIYYKLEFSPYRYIHIS